MGHPLADQLLAALTEVAPWALLTPRTSDGWGSHVPVLLGLSILLSPRSVVEFGSGSFSTRLFADKRYFPSVDQFRSVEDSPVWHQTAMEATIHKRGVDVQLVDRMSRWIRASAAPLGGLIFVDNGKTRRDRIAAITATFDRVEDDAVVVLHDFENRHYRRAVPRSWPFITVKAWRPMTAVACRDEARRDSFGRLARVIEAHRHIRPVDCETWFPILQRLL